MLVFLGIIVDYKSSFVTYDTQFLTNIHRYDFVPCVFFCCKSGHPLQSPVPRPVSLVSSDSNSERRRLGVWYDVARRRVYRRLL